MKSPIDTVADVIERAKDGTTLSGLGIASVTGLKYTTVVDAIRQLHHEGRATICEVVRSGVADIDVRRALSIKPATFQTTLVVAPNVVTREIQPPTTSEPTMPRPKTLEHKTKLGSALAETLLAVSDMLAAGQHVTARLVAEKLDIKNATSGNRLTVLKDYGLLSNDGPGSAAWDVTAEGREWVEKLKTTSNGGPVEAKVAEDARKQTTFAKRLQNLEEHALAGLTKATGELNRTLDALDSQVAPLAPPAPAHPVFGDFRGAPGEPTYPTRAAITDMGEVMLFDGPPDTTAPTVIPPHMARKLVSLLRTLPSNHALALEA